MNQSKKEGRKKEKPEQRIDGTNRKQDDRLKPNHITNHVKCKGSDDSN